jgi:GDPmannose 4,6-dehydratase
VTDPRFLRPAEVDLLIGDAGRARDRLGWTPTTTFPELVAMMVDADLRTCAQMLQTTNGAATPRVSQRVSPAAQSEHRRVR